MADVHTPDHAGAHHGPGFKAYMVVFGALSIFTAISFLVNDAVRHEVLSPHAGFALILGVAVIKAILVGTYFMHLIVDWPKLYYMIFPTFILAAMMLIVFLPDMVLNWSSTTPPPSPPLGPVK